MQTNASKAHKTVADYFASLVWDGIPRIEHWLIDCAGAEDSLHTREVSRRMLVDAVRRARHPGCKIDRMAVLVGPQGCGKSEALRMLAVKGRWFTDDLPLHGNIQHFMDVADGKWIVEVGELDGMGKKDVEALKTCLSREHDEARRTYDHRTTRVARQFVIVGTTGTTDFLPDGADRRFCPVEVRCFDLDRLRALRDQLWAEAVTVEYQLWAEALAEAVAVEASVCKMGGAVETRSLTVVLDGSCGTDDVVAIEQAIRRFRGVITVVSDLDEIKASLQATNARILALKDKKRT